MSSISLEFITNSNGLLETYLIFVKHLSKLCLLVILVYVSLFAIGGKRNGLWVKWKTFKRQVELVNKYPGLSMYPFIGSITQMINLSIDPCRDMFPWVKQMVQKHGPIYRFWLLSQPKIFIACSETAVKCLQNESFPGRPSETIEVGRQIGGEGLIVLPPDIHFHRKKMWKHWFTRKHINEQLELFQKEAIRLCDVLSMETSKPFDAVPHFLHLAFRTITGSAFGENYVNSISEATGKQHVKDLSTLSHNLFARIFRPWLANDFIFYNLTASGRETMRCAKSAQELTKEALKHGKLLRNNNFNRMDPNANGCCFLDHLLSIHEQGDLSENELLQELNNFIVGGYDTTGLTIGWFLYLIACHPEYQTKVVDELFQLLGGKLKDFSGPIKPSDLQNMRYLELCIKETLRLYPITFLIFRQSYSADACMPDGKIIPPGVDIYMPLRVIHMDPKYFPEPEKFIPERHLVPISAYMPFGLGSRNCIGQVYAMQEMKMVLAHLLMEYKWETLEKTGLEPLTAPLCYPANGLRFQISKRNYLKLNS